jgi:cytochrome c-type biogenesis protein CcmH/NrfF
VSLRAQQGMPGASTAVDTHTSYYPRNDLERKLQHEIVCTCGACGHTTIAECRKDPCPVSHQMRAELAALIDQGKSHDEIIQTFVQKYGSEEMLGAPLDKGFNRLAWLLPWALGTSGAVLVGFAAMKWSKQHPAVEAAAPVDPVLDERLDDELRNLD